MFSFEFIVGCLTVFNIILLVVLHQKMFDSLTVSIVVSRAHHVILSRRMLYISSGLRYYNAVPSIPQPWATVEALIYIDIKRMASDSNSL